ncbi:hypothetical protein FW000_09055, partial [Campylobacter jejuni]|nr:hypothetical protein [Campylobacter jejuni]
MDIFNFQKENKEACLLIYSDKELDFQNNDKYIHISELEELYEYVKNDKQAYFGMLDIRDFYGENYLLDLVLTLKYSKFNAFGKYSFYEF